MIDCAAYIGPYPFRELPHPEPAILEHVVQRDGLSGAWVGYLPAPWQRDPAEGNSRLFEQLVPHPQLKAAPVVRPDWPRWEAALRECLDRGAAAVRAYPMHWGFSYNSGAMTSLANAVGEAGVPLVLTVRFEDLRQRSGLDVAGDLTAAHIRSIARTAEHVRLVVTGAGRDLIEETHWSLTPGEQRRIFWDFAWVWGPPEDHLLHLLQTIGAERFVYGTHWPLRLTQNSRANLDLIPRDSVGTHITDASTLTRRA